VNLLFLTWGFGEQFQRFPRDFTIVEINQQSAEFAIEPRAL
jgi:hypothetical protein